MRCRAYRFGTPDKATVVLSGGFDSYLVAFLSVMLTRVTLVVGISFGGGPAIRAAASQPWVAHVIRQVGDIAPSVHVRLDGLAGLDEPGRNMPSTAGRP